MNFFQFEYAGQKYKYMAYMFAPTNSASFEDTLRDNQRTPKFMLSFEGIRSIEYWNGVMDPLIYGQITYFDMYQDVSVYIGMPYAYCHVVIEKIVTEDAAQFGAQSDFLFSHTFLVTSIDLLEKAGSRFLYRINLVSQNWWNFNANVNYSNYGKSQPETVTQIVQALFRQQGLSLNVPDTLNIKDRIYYISTPQDTLYSAYKHLLSKVYSRYAGFELNTICPIVYDDISGQYSWINIKDENTYPSQIKSNSKYVEQIYVSLITDIGQILAQGETFLGSANNQKRTDVYSLMKRVNKVGYDFSSGKFYTESCSQTQMSKYLESQMQNQSRKQKFIPYDSTQQISQKPSQLNGLKFHETVCDWDNSINNFTRGLATLVECDTAVVNVAGLTSRKPGIAVYVNFDTSELSQTASEGGVEQYEKFKSKMVGLIGMWFVTGVYHTIDFTGAQPIFRDSLQLGRNFRMG